MQIPLELRCANVEKTPQLEDLIARKVEKLHKVCDYIVSCRVAVEREQKLDRPGNPFRVRITVRVPPQHEIVVTREGKRANTRDSLDAVIREAFEAMRRQLTKLTELQRGDVKTRAGEETEGESGEGI